VGWRLQPNFMRDGLHAEILLLQPQVKPALGKERKSGLELQESTVS